MAKLRKKMKYNCKSGLQLFEGKVLLLTKRLKKTRGNEHANDKNVLMTAKRIRH